MEEFILDSSAGVPVFIPSVFVNQPGVKACFSTRLGGVSDYPMDSMNLGLFSGDSFAHLQENYRRLACFFDKSTDCIRISRQVHGDAVLQVTSQFPPAGIIADRDFEADALITDLPGVILITHHADCAPVFLYDPVKKCIALIHSGWRGTACRISEKTVQRMEKCFGTRSSDLLCAVGPRIGKCCFETDGDVPSEMLRTMPDIDRSCLVGDGAGKYHVDLGAIIRYQLLCTGVKEENISISDLCTCCRTDLFFSHRKTGKMRGTLAAAMMLTEDR